MAVAVWGIVVAPRYGVAKRFVEYAAVSISFLFLRVAAAD